MQILNHYLLCTILSGIVQYMLVIMLHLLFISMHHNFTVYINVSLNNVQYTITCSVCFIGPQPESKFLQPAVFVQTCVHEFHWYVLYSSLLNLYNNLLYEYSTILKSRLFLISAIINININNPVCIFWGICTNFL